MSQDFQKLVDEYAAIANFIDEEEAKIRVYKKARENIKAALMAKMNELGITNAKAAGGGSVTIVNGTSATIVDGEAFFDFVFETGNTDMLTKRASADAVRDYLDVTGELPPGIEITTTQTMRFNR